MFVFSFPFKPPSPKKRGRNQRATAAPSTLRLVLLSLAGEEHSLEAHSADPVADLCFRAATRLEKQGRQAGARSGPSGPSELGAAGPAGFFVFLGARSRALPGSPGNEDRKKGYPKRRKGPRTAACSKPG